MKGDWKFRTISCNIARYIHRMAYFTAFQPNAGKHLPSIKDAQGRGSEASGRTSLALRKSVAKQIQKFKRFFYKKTPTGEGGCCRYKKFIYRSTRRQPILVPSEYIRFGTSDRYRNGKRCVRQTSSYCQYFHHGQSHLMFC